jgi:hypothetical protein
LACLYVIMDLEATADDSRSNSGGGGGNKINI